MKRQRIDLSGVENPKAASNRVDKVDAEEDGDTAASNPSAKHAAIESVRGGEKMRRKNGNGEEKKWMMGGAAAKRFARDPLQLQKSAMTKEEKTARFRYGNFNRYYGIRLGTSGDGVEGEGTSKGVAEQVDPRLALLPREWFEGKAILDVGCNVGYLTLTLAKDYRPTHILGIDIDENLIGVARKNIRHYCDKSIEMLGKYPASATIKLGKRANEFATTGRIQFSDSDDEDNEEVEKKGGIRLQTSSANSVGRSGTASGRAEPYSSESSSFSTPPTSSTFPNNVWFLRENYVLEADEDLEMVRGEYNVVLALSITKWIHLNWGDAGLKRFFKRAFLNLLPGGRLIAEFQPFSSYAKRSKTTPEMRENYRGIAFKPEEFTEYLLSPEVGFTNYTELGVPKSRAKGFERPLLCFQKAA